MKTSDAGIQLIKAHEGLRLKAYRCPSGVLTIGYGHTKNVRENQSIDEQTAEQLLREDIVTAESAVKGMKVKLKQCQFDALVSFVFNIGIGAFKSSTIYYAIMRGYTDLTVASLMMKWIYSKGSVVPGLVKRRAAEANMYLGINKYKVKK